MSLLPSPDRPEPVHCPECEEGFAHARDLHLHLGRVHGASLDDEAQARFEVALADEAAWLDSFRRHMRSALAALPVLVVYGIVLVTGYMYRARPTMMLLPLPGIVGFAVITYYMAYRHQRGDEV